MLLPKVRRDKEHIRKAILEVTKDLPRTPIGIIKELENLKDKKGKKKLEKKEIPRINKIRSDFLNKLEMMRKLFRIDKKDKENLERYNLVKENKRGKPPEAYYVNVENSGAFELTKIFDVFIKKLGEFIDNKKEIEERILNIQGLLVEFELKNVNEPGDNYIKKIKNSKFLKKDLKKYGKEFFDKESLQFLYIKGSLESKGLSDKKFPWKLRTFWEEKDDLKIITDKILRKSIFETKNMKTTKIAIRIHLEIAILYGSLNKQINFNSILNKIIEQKITL